MKKNLILSAALLLSATAAMAQSGTFTLKANLKNFGDTVIVFKNRGVKNDTVLVKRISSLIQPLWTSQCLSFSQLQVHSATQNTRWLAS